MKRIELEIQSNLVLVQRWADYTQKYGIGYKLTSGNYGALFNDGTTITSENGKYYGYIGKEQTDMKTYSVKDYPKFLEKKVTLLKSFIQYINKMEEQSKHQKVPHYLEMK